MSRTATQGKLARHSNNDNRTGVGWATAAVLALVACATGCVTTPSSSVPEQSVSAETPGESPAASPASVVLIPNDGSVESPVADAPRHGDEDIPNKAPVAPVVNDGTDAAEETTVTGKRIRRWLPFVGAAWPDENCQLSTRDVGRGELRTVFIADLGRNGKTWRDVAELLGERGGRAKLVTLPGSDGVQPCTWRGPVLSHATELVASIVENSGPVSLIGDTFGAHVALEVAAQGTPDVHDVVLFDLVPHLWPLQNPAFKALRLAYVSPAVFASQARVAPPGWWSLTSGASFLANDFEDKDVLTEFRRSYRLSDPVTVCYEFFRTHGPKADMRPLVARIQKPMLAIWPTGPEDNERKHLAEVAAQYADVQGVTWHALRGHGAGAMLEAPGLVADAIVSFWDEIGFSFDRMPTAPHLVEPAPTHPVGSSAGSM